MNRIKVHLFVAFALALVVLSGAHHAFRDFVVDKRFQFFPREASGEIVLVTIDPQSISAIGKWPWPRQLHAELIRQLLAANVAEIVFDVDFSVPSNPESDAAFAEALREAGGSVVLPAFRQWIVSQQKRSIHVNRPLPEFERHSWSAIVNVSVDPDGLVRRYDFGDVLEGEFLPSIGALLAGRYETGRSAMLIDHSIRHASVPTVSYIDIIRGDEAALALVAGRKVVIGATAIELGDYFSVPNGAVIAGPLLQILAAESLLQDRDLYLTSEIVDVAFVIFVFALMASFLDRKTTFRKIWLLVALMAIVETAATISQVHFAFVMQTGLWHALMLAYFLALGLNEIDFKSLLSGIAEGRFRRVAMSLGDGLVCAGPDGKVTLWNAGAEVIFGYTESEMIGQDLSRIRADGRPIDLDQFPGDAGAGQGREARVLEFEGIRKNGDLFTLEASFSSWMGVEGPEYGVVLRDISEKKREAEKIRYLAEHDTLTGLANRHALTAFIQQAIAGGDHKTDRTALILLDLDKFKSINDSLGHAFGDELLKAVGQDLRDLAAGGALVSRLGGDEFAVVVTGSDCAALARSIAMRVCEHFAEKQFIVSERQLRVNVSIGIAVSPDHGDTLDAIFGNADLALYSAKSLGRGRYVVFHEDIRVEMDARLALEAALGKALERNELELFYQPQFDAATGLLAGAEALIRWNDPERGLVPPAMFMPFVNSSTISNRVAAWVIDTACRQASTWQRKGQLLRIGVNLSPSQFHSKDLVANIERSIVATGLDPRLLELEVTEDITLESDELAESKFAELRRLGVSLAFDDFGTGYASLMHLKKFALDVLKIDRSFVKGLRANPEDAAIIGSTISLGRFFGMRIIAEGVEDEDTTRILMEMGCDELQGYLYGQPVPAAAFEEIYLPEGRRARIELPARRAADKARAA